MSLDSCTNYQHRRHTHFRREGLETLSNVMIRVKRSIIMGRGATVNFADGGRCLSVVCVAKSLVTKAT
jgi:hypothetical protein